MEEYYNGAETSPHNCRDRETQLYRHIFASWEIILAPTYTRSRYDESVPDLLEMPAKLFFSRQNLMSFLKAKISNDSCKTVYSADGKIIIYYWSKIHIINRSK